MIKIEAINMSNYIKWIREKVGNERIILNFAGACITNDKGELLLQKRSGNDNIWGLPGGALEIGESIEEAAKREVKEETGLNIEVDYLIGVYSKYLFEYSNGDKSQSICYFFKGTITSGELYVDNKETFALQFFAKDNLTPLFTEQHADAITDFFDGKTGIYR